MSFTVADSGIGLTADHMGRLFRPFSQADTSISRKYGGTGLGLALVWRFCKLMGGEVSVESELGKGARFTVVLPANVVDRPKRFSPGCVTALPAAYQRLPASTRHVAALPDHERARELDHRRCRAD